MFSCIYVIKYFNINYIYIIYDFKKIMYILWKKLYYVYIMKKNKFVWLKCLFGPIYTLFSIQKYNLLNNEK